MVRTLIIVLLIYLLAGCDRYSGPLLQNGFSSEIEVTVLYEDGSEYSEVWVPCKRVFIGASEIGRLGLDKKETSISTIIVEKEGEVVHRFDEQEINSLIGKAKKQKNGVVWLLNADGVRFSVDSAEECIK